MSAVITACVWSVVDNVRAAFHNGWGTVPILFRLHHLKLLTWLLFRHKTVYQGLPTPLCTLSSISCVPEILPCCTAPEFSLWAPCIFSSHERHLHLGFLCPVTLINSFNAAYSEVVHCRLNLFKFPFGKAGKSFVSELARLYKAFASSSAMESIAMKAAIVQPIVLPSFKSKAKEHRTCLDRRLNTWLNRDLNDLLLEEEQYSCVSLNHNHNIVRSALHAPLPS